MKSLHMALLMGSLMTARDADIAATAGNAAAQEPSNVDLPISGVAGEIGTQEVLPDPTEGNRGPSRTANSSGNVGDPTMELHGDAGEVIRSPQTEPVIANSTNAVTDLAYNRLAPMTEVVVKLDREVTSTFDVKPVFTELLGTTNISAGPYNTAIRSNVYAFREGHGQRAAIIYRDGTCRLLPSGSTYYDWYGQVQKDDVALCAIVYFDQRKTAENPFVAVRWYKKAELPAVATDIDDSL